MNSFQRIDRISEEVRREVDRIIREDLNDPRITGTWSITRAEVTGDLRYAKIYVSVLEDEVREPLMEALKILEDNKEHYMSSSAAISIHHNIKGGLLYHSYRMVKAADALCKVYSILDRELLICGAALHDIGKIWEFNTSAAGSAETAKPGVLFGHLYMGAALIKDYTKGMDYSKEKVQMLIHLILSHHGTQEFGAVACPATPEAFALHNIDELDARIYMCEDHFEKLAPGEFTEKKPFGIDNRLYKANYRK